MAQYNVPGTRQEAIERTLERGVFAGFAAAIPMGLFAMVASATYMGDGFFTPAYHVAFLIDAKTMGMSLDAAAAGDRFFFSHEPFVMGIIGHLMVAGFLGAVFAFVARWLRLRGTRALVGGLLYGLAVMAFMSVVALPAAASLAGAGTPISRMGAEIGWITFAVEHLLYGLALGLWLCWRPEDVHWQPQAGRVAGTARLPGEPGSARPSTSH